MAPDTCLSDDCEFIRMEDNVPVFRVKADGQMKRRRRKRTKETEPKKEVESKLCF